MRAIGLLLVAAAIVLGALALTATDAQAAKPQPPVSVVYFYPRDQEPAVANVALIDPSVQAMQDWYGALVGSTFSASIVQPVEGKKSTAQYQDTFWGDILREMGYYCGTGVHLVILHESIAPGFAGGGSCSGDGGGSAIVSERWLGSGAVPHELGHAFALPHPQGCASNPTLAYCAETVMWAWWRYPAVGLLSTEIEVLQASPWFGSAGGEPDACEPKFNRHGKRIGKCR